MADSALSDDYSQWPSDPYELLGVPRDADERQVKRAYTALIRRFHPEDFPEHFRRIRAAYDAAKGWLEYRVSPSTFVPPESDSSPGEEDPGATEAGVRGEPASSSSGFASQLDVAWELACDGQVEQADLQLKGLQRNHAHDPALCIRRYWLRVIDPDLTKEEPAHVILEKFLAADFATDVVQLYLAVIEQDPQIATTANAWAVVQNTAIQPWLPELLRHRWGVLGQQSKWKTLESELDSFFSVLAFDQPVLWQSLNVLACEAAVFQGEADLGNRLLARLQQLQNDAVARSYMTDRNHDRVAILEMVLAERKHDALRTPSKAPQDPAVFVRLLSSTSMQSDHLFFQKLMSCCLQEWVKSPAQVLKQLDLLQKWYPAFAFELWGRISRLYELRFDGNIEFADLEIRVLGDMNLHRHLYSAKSQETLLAASRNDLTLLRWPAYAFCREEFVTLEQLSTVLSEVLIRHYHVGPQYQLNLMQDRSLATLIKGTLLFWS